MSLNLYRDGPDNRLAGYQIGLLHIRIPGMAAGYVWYPVRTKYPEKSVSGASLMSALLNLASLRVLFFLANIVQKLHQLNSKDTPA